MRGGARVLRVFLSYYVLVCLLYTSITYGKDILVEKPVPVNPCTIPTLGLSILQFPPQPAEETFDYGIGSLFDFSILKNKTGIFQVFYRNKHYDGICFKADIFRGIRLRASDLEFWRASKRNKAILSVTKYGDIQYWFTANHTNDEGATS